MRPSFHAAAAVFGRRQIRAVEVGVEQGYNAANALFEWPHGTLHLTLIERETGREDEINKVILERVGREHFTLIFGDSAEVAATLADESFDFVYLDDDHEPEGVHKSVTAWGPKVKRGGILGGHDIDMPSVKAEVVHLVGRTGWPLYISENDWWVLVG